MMNEGMFFYILGHIATLAPIEYEVIGENMTYNKF